MAGKLKAVPLQFKEQSEFFRRKLNLPTTKWNDIYGPEHDFAFVVAGANRDDIVAAFKDAIDKAINEGETLEQFRKRFDAIVAKTGWSYKGGRNWRTRIIYETNLNSSYMAGRYQQMMEVKDARPYWMYVHNDSVEHPRPHHKAWGDLPIVLPWNHPWWNKHFPPNGWGCQCRVFALSEDDLQRMGLKVSDIPWEEEPGVPEGIDPSFEHIPGKARLLSEIPPEMPQPPMGGSTGGPGLPNTRPAPKDTLPSPRNMDSSNLLPDGLLPEEYANTFLTELGGSLAEPFVIKDVIGERLVVDASLFKNKKGEWKATKRGREIYMKLLALTLKSPDEIWVRLEYHNAKKQNVVRRRYIAQFQLADDPVPLLVVFESGDDGWYGVTAHSGEDVNVENWRVGIRLYRRE